jgi:hypothetical protein
MKVLPKGGTFFYPVRGIIVRKGLAVKVNKGFKLPRPIDAS